MQNEKDLSLKDLVAKNSVLQKLSNLLLIQVSKVGMKPSMPAFRSNPQPCIFVLCKSIQAKTVFWLDKFVITGGNKENWLLNFFDTFHWTHAINIAICGVVKKGFD
jgi:hypothetical protein